MEKSKSKKQSQSFLVAHVTDAAAAVTVTTVPFGAYNGPW